MGSAEPTPTGGLGERLGRVSFVWSRSLSILRRWNAFWAVFRTNRLAILGLVMLLVFVGMAVSAPVLRTAGLLRDPDLIDTTNLYQRPSTTYLLGTDQLGRDLFSRMWFGSQVTLLVGALASLISMGVGTVVGLISGYYGGWLDELLMRTTDFFLVLPTLVLALVLAVVLPPPGVSLTKLVIVIGVSLWATTARLVRAQVLSLKERQFVERARAIGASGTRIVFVHIFPNTFTLVFAEAILTIAVAILTESFLSFIHLGPADSITWGRIIEDALAHGALEQRLYWWVVAPGLFIVGVVLAFTLLGFALDEIVNPRLRRR